MNNMELKGNSKQGLTGATLGFFIGFAAVALYGSTVTVFKQSFAGINPILLALLVSAPSLSGSLLRIPFAAWVDTTGGRKPFLVLLVLSIIGMLGLYIVMAFFKENLGQYYWLLFSLAILSGCGIATFSVGVSQTSYWFPQSKQGYAAGIYGGVGNIAPGIFMVIIPNIALPLWGLSGSYLAWLIFLTIGTIIYFFIGQNAWYFQLIEKGVNKEEAREIASKKYGQELFPNNKVSESLGMSAKSWKTWALVGIYFATFGGFMALTSWFPTYWTSLFKVSMKTAGLLTALYSIVTSITRIYAGKIADKKGGEATALISLSIMLVGAVFLTLSSSISFSVIGILILALGMGATNAAVFKIVPKAVPHAVGGASGWIGGIGALGGFILPPIMASFIDNSGTNLTGYSTGFVVFIALAVAAIIILTVINKVTKSSSKN